MTIIKTIRVTYFGKTFSFPVTTIEAGLDNLERVEAGDVDAEDALEFGVKIGDEKDDGLNKFELEVDDAGDEAV